MLISYSGQLIAFVPSFPPSSRVLGWEYGPAGPCLCAAWSGGQWGTIAPMPRPSPAKVGVNPFKPPMLVHPGVSLVGKFFLVSHLRLVGIGGGKTGG